MFEVEKKALIFERDSLVDSLKSIEGIEFQKKVVKGDIYFSLTRVRSYKELGQQSLIFRVRYAEDQFVLTLKNKSLVGNTEVNDEREVVVEKGSEDEIKEFFRVLNQSSLSEEKIENLFNLKTQAQWIDFLEKERFFFLITKEKETELWNLFWEDYFLNIEVNYLKNLGNFLEVEVLCEDKSKVDKAIKSIDSFFAFLGIKKEQEENRLYLELLFEKQDSLS